MSSPFLQVFSKKIDQKYDDVLLCLNDENETTARKSCSHNHLDAPGVAGSRTDDGKTIWVPHLLWIFAGAAAPERSSARANAFCALKQSDLVERTTVSIDRRIMTLAQRRMRALGIRKFSQYIALLLEKDHIERGPLMIVKEERFKRPRSRKKA